MKNIQMITLNLLSFCSSHNRFKKKNNVVFAWEKWTFSKLYKIKNKEYIHLPNRQSFFFFLLLFILVVTRFNQQY